MLKELGNSLELAREDQIILVINDILHNIMCTPEKIEELVSGFLISEGFASNLNEIEINACFKDSKTFLIKINEDVPNTTLRSSGCIGVFRENEELPEVTAEERFNLDEARGSLQYLDVEEYKRTRGYHIAALVDKKGLITRAHDVGRHNAVDKVIGTGLENGINFKKVFLLTSGRISRGMALKCVRTGIPLIVSKAAILDSAIDVCLKTGLTAISFATNVAVGENLPNYDI